MYVVACSLRAQKDRKSTRLNSSHMSISYAVFCLKKKRKHVIVVDQEGEQSLGGQAYWSFGGLFLVDSPEQRRLGIKDSYYLSLLFFNDTATTEIYTLSLHDALPI